MKERVVAKRNSGGENIPTVLALCQLSDHPSCALQAADSNLSVDQSQTLKQFLQHRSVMAP